MQVDFFLFVQPAQAVMKMTDRQVRGRLPRHAIQIGQRAVTGLVGALPFREISHHGGEPALGAVGGRSRSGHKLAGFLKLIEHSLHRRLKGVETLLPAARRRHQLAHMGVASFQCTDKVFKDLLGTDLVQEIGQPLLRERADFLGSLASVLGMKDAQKTFFLAAQGELLRRGRAGE